MEKLGSKFQSMESELKRNVLLELCGAALSVWEQGFKGASNPSYQESVTGSVQLVEIDLPRHALREIVDLKSNCGVCERYREPIVALQDMDWELPDHLELAYYAIYNAHRRYRLNEAIDERLILQQALSSLPVEKCEATFQAAMARATGQDVSSTIR
ncbi:MAG: hypothetical protein JNJ55_06140 [Betaproteobacteria bacterium]|nr:hypothetical protein [Betaproteobacteria bacterium]